MHHIDAELGSLPRDRALAALAARQHGVVSVVQLRRLGVHRGAVARRVAGGRLHRIHRGIYAVGHPVLSAEGRWMAAVLAVGRAAALSHRSAAALWGLRRTGRAAIEVTTSRKGHPRSGVEVHRVRSLPDDEVARVRGIPCTTVARTLVDLAEVLLRRDLERVIDQAEVGGLFDERALASLIRRHPKRRGARALRAILDEHAAGSTLTRSQLEERFLALCMGAGLASPELNVPVRLPDGGVAIVDALWRPDRLVVETDGRAAHATRAAFERDRRRDAQLLLAGYRVVRLTWRQVTDDRFQVVATLRALLAGTAPAQHPSMTR